MKRMTIYSHIFSTSLQRTSISKCTHSHFKNVIHQYDELPILSCIPNEIKINIVKITKKSLLRMLHIKTC